MPSSATVPAAKRPPQITSPRRFDTLRASTPSGVMDASPSTNQDFLEYLPALELICKCNAAQRAFVCLDPRRGSHDSCRAKSQDARAAMGAANISTASSA
jgi:hypothetical protein